MNRTDLGKFGSWYGCIPVSAVALLLIGATVACNPKASSFYTECQDKLKASLKSPASALFPSRPVRIWLAKTSSAAYLRSYVDAQNSFGALLRTDFICARHIGSVQDLAVFLETDSAARILVIVLEGEVPNIPNGLDGEVEADIKAASLHRYEQRRRSGERAERRSRANSEVRQDRVLRGGMSMTTAKEELTRLIQTQPDDSSREEIVRELAFHLMIERGVADSDARRVITNEDMARRIRSWPK